MKSRFALPAAIALSFEAVLLLGFNQPHPTSTVTVVRFNNPDPAPMPQDDPAPVVQDDSGGSSNPSQKSSAQLPEPQPVDNQPGIKVPVPQSSPPGIPTVDRPMAPTIGGQGNGNGDGPGPIDFSKLDNAPVAKSQQSPIYPYEAARELRKGEVVVEFTVDEAGHVFDPQVVRSTNRIFEEATIRAVSHWVFEPGKKNGRAVRFRMMVPVEFQVDGN